MLKRFCYSRTNGGRLYPNIGTRGIEDEETTKARAKSMVDLITAQKAAAEKAIKAELLKGTPKPKPGEGDTELSLKSNSRK